MADTIDPMMKDLVEDFYKENADLLAQLQTILEQVEDQMDQAGPGLEKFGQIIDRIMGAAKAFGLKTMANFCELGKIIGYKSGQTKEKYIHEIVVAILFDSVDLLTKMNKQLKETGSTDLKNLSTQAFASRLQWLSEKFKHIDRASCNFESGATPQQVDQNSIDDLLADLGL